MSLVWNIKRSWVRYRRHYWLYTIGMLFILYLVRLYYLWKYGGYSAHDQCRRFGASLDPDYWWEHFDTQEIGLPCNAEEHIGPVFLNELLPVLLGIGIAMVFGRCLYLLFRVVWTRFEYRNRVYDS